MPTFISKANELQVTLEAEGIPLRDHMGLVVGRTPGKRIQFRRGLYHANATEARRLGYESVDDLVHAIKHTADGNPRMTFGSEFFEQGNEPGAQHPPVDKLLADIADASVRRHEKRLVQIVEQEEDTHKREVVLTSAKAALAALGNTEKGKQRPGRPHPVKPEDEQEAPTAA